jgi:glycosyltransferase involved in cell wall biosynthesis
MLSAKVVFASDIFAGERRILPDGRRIYSTADAYQQARLVTYPSTVEGFGNAFLEALYYRKPLVMSRYEIYRSDIQPKGFRIIAFDEFISDETLDQVRSVLDDPALAAAIGDHNYELGRRFYSFRTLERRLTLLVQDALGTDPEDYLFASS